MLGLRTYYFRLLASAYATYTLSSSHGWGGVPGLHANFGVTTPTLGPDATVEDAAGGCRRNNRRDVPHRVDYCADDPSLRIRSRRRRAGSCENDELCANRGR